MSEQNFCKSCKKNLDKIEFTLEDKIYKTCNICRAQRSEKRKKNICQECGIVGIFNYEGEKNGIRCSSHKEIGMINIKDKTCTYETCRKIPNYNFEGKTRALFCFEHKENEMVNIISKKCEDKNCKKQPEYNFENETQFRFCSKHKKEGMVNIKNLKYKKCEKENCKKQPCFNFEGQIKGRFCTKHKEKNMINVKIKYCKYTGCRKEPRYNFKDEIKGLYCAEHKENNMINLFNCCKYKDCKKISSYNFKGEKNPIFCSDHKSENMINIRTTICKHEDCNITASYNKKGESNALFCDNHKEIGMVNVKSKLCQYDKCQTRATFGYINQTATHCARHKLPLMFTKRKVECQEEGCEEISEYGIEEPTHCYLHQKENEICLLGQTCKNCNRENELCNKDQICLTYCRPTELSVTAKKIIKKKEALVLSYLDKNIKTDIKSIDDRIIDTSCVKRRPDRVYDCGSYFLIVEVDENQHKSYSNGCSFDVKTQELRRMVQIHEALSSGMIPVIFLRFNPDNYKVGGTLQKINMQKRLDILSKWVTHCLNLKEDPEQPSIRIKHLFYDEYQESNIKFETIEDMKSLI